VVWRGVLGVATSSLRERGPLDSWAAHGFGVLYRPVGAAVILWEGIAGQTKAQSPPVQAAQAHGPSRRR
jgi:hypothetical protein